MKAVLPSLRPEEAEELSKGEHSAVQQGQAQSPVPGRNNPLHHYRLGVNLLENISAQKDLGVLMDNKCTVSEQCAPVAKKPNDTLECIKKSMTSKAEKGFPPPPLFCPNKATSGEQCPVLGSPIQEGQETTGEGPKESYKDDEGPGASLL